MTARAVTAGAVVAGAALLAILVWPEAVGVQRSFPVALLVSLRVLLGVAAVVVAIPFVVLAVRQPRARVLGASIAALLVLFGAANAVIVTGRGLAETSGGASGITVLSWNTLGGAPGADVIARLAIDSGAEVVSLPETTRETGAEVAAIMASAGMPVQQFTTAYDEASSARSTTLLVAESLGEYTSDSDAVTTLVLPTVVATPVSGDGPTLLAVHTLAPLPPMVSAWSDDLDWVAAACLEPNVIVAGDFNATVDHLGTLGLCRDAATAAGSAGAGTWPTWLPTALASPIDHVMATANWRVTGFRVIQSHDGYGSDHRPVLAQLSPAG